MANGTSQAGIPTEPQVFTATFQPVNGSGVSGSARISVDGSQMRVEATFSGLEAGRAHPVHLHGLTASDGTPVDNSPISPALDTDRDGYVEQVEAQRAVGPILVDLGSPVAMDDGTLQLDRTLDLNALQGLSPGHSVAELFPLDFRALQIDGLSVRADASQMDGSGTVGEVSGTFGYKDLLPVADGPLTAEPAAATATATTATATTAAAAGPATGSAAIAAAPVSSAGTATAVTAPAEERGTIVRGTAGNDDLTGGNGDDILVGGRGNDVLDGGVGNDDLVGGRGADRFVFGQGKDVVVSFNPAEGDRLAFSNQSDAGTMVVQDTKQGTWISSDEGAPNDPATQGVLLLGVHADSTAEANGWFA